MYNQPMWKKKAVIIYFIVNNILNLATAYCFLSETFEAFTQNKNIALANIGTFIFTATILFSTIWFLKSKPPISPPIISSQNFESQDVHCLLRDHYFVSFVYCLYEHL